jgi:hypothetical protein
MARVVASEQTRKRIADVLSGDFDKSALLRNAVRLIVEEALEAEVGEVLGRGYYERGEPAGYRNGNRLGRLKTAEGIVEYAVPQRGQASALGTDRGTGAAGGEDVRAGVIDARHRGGLHRRRRPLRADQKRGQPGDRAAVGGLCRLYRPRSGGATDPLPSFWMGWSNGSI